MLENVKKSMETETDQAPVRIPFVGNEILKAQDKQWDRLREPASTLSFQNLIAAAICNKQGFGRRKIPFFRF